MMILSNVLALALIVADGPATPAQSPAPAKPHGVADGVGPWHLGLPEAIRIGLENSEVVRVIRLGGTAGAPDDGNRVVIARLNADASPWNFKAAILAHVRSIEQQYWAIAHQAVTLWSRETAVRLGTEILARAKADLETGRSTRADVAEAEQQLENFRLNLLTATSDLITTQRQLRNILGLSATDERPIVTDTRPLEAKLELKWEDCLAAMNVDQPDLAQQRQLVEAAQFQAQLEEGNPQLTDEQRRSTLAQVERQRAFLDQVRHQVTRSLARFYEGIDSDYKHFDKARQLRAAAQKRLEAQRAFYEEGRITIDRLLDAVAQYANAIAQESEYRSSYNTAIAALEEAKGTLLARDGITVAEGPVSRRFDPPAKTDAVVRASFPKPEPVTPPAAAARYKLKASLGGMKLIEIEVEVAPVPAKP